MTATMTKPEAAEATDGPVTAPDGPEAPEGRPVDAEAPYGRTAAGKPRSKPGRKPTAKTAPPPPRRKPSGGPRRTAARPDYRKGLLGLVQVASAPLLIAAQRSEAAAADVAALGMHAPAVVEAVNDLAAEDPRIAGVLDRLMSVGPYGALLAAVVPLGVQLAVNHRAVPLEVGRGMGAEDPAALAASVRRSAARAAAAAGAAAAGAGPS